MQKYVDLILHVMETVRQYGKFDVLLCISLLYLYLCCIKEKKAEEIGKAYPFDTPVFLYGILGFLILWNPLVIMGIIQLATEFVDYWRLLWLIPMLIILAYVGTRIATEHMGDGKEKYIRIALITCVIILAGTINPYQSNSLKKAETLYGIPTKDMQVLQYFDDKDEDIMLLAPNAVMEQARRYNGKIKTVYGRDLWSSSAVTYRIDAYEQVLYTLCDWMQKPSGNEENITKAASGLHCNYLVVSNGRAEQEAQETPRDPNAVVDMSVAADSFEKNGYHVVETTDYYYILKQDGI